MSDMSEKPQPCRHKRPFCLECHGGEFQGSVSVKRTAIEYLKRNHPSACERAGLCETIGGRQYTVTLSCHGYVLASDHEALQAECEKLRKDAERYRWLRADALSAYEDDLDEPQLVYARECAGDYQDCIDAAIDAAMKEPPQ